MAWIELTSPLEHHGVERKPGDRIDYPTRAAQALVARDKAFWCSPPKPSTSSKPRHKEVEAVEYSPGEPQKEEPEGQEYEKPEPEDSGADHGWPTLEQFNALEKPDQKEVIRRAGLTEEADLRSPNQMAIAYGAYCSENDIPLTSEDTDG